MSSEINSHLITHTTKRMIGPIEQINFSIRVYNSLKRSKIDFIDQLVSMSDEQILSLRNLGQESLLEIKEKIAPYLVGYRNTYNVESEEGCKRISATNDHLEYLAQRYLRGTKLFEKYETEFSSSIGLLVIFLITNLNGINQLISEIGPLFDESLIDQIYYYSSIPLTKAVGKNLMKVLEETEYFKKYNELKTKTREKIKKNEICNKLVYKEKAMQIRIQEHYENISLFEMLENNDIFNYIATYSIKDEISYLTLDLDDREKRIFVHRNFIINLTLENLSGVFNVTRERIRQIERSVIRKVEKRLKLYQFEFIYLENAILAINNWGSKFTFNEWLKKVFNTDESQKNILLHISRFDELVNNVDLFISLIPILKEHINGGSSNWENKVIMASKYPNNLFSAIKYKQELSKNELNKIRKIVRNSGAISTRNNIFKSQREVTKKQALLMLGYEPILNEWFTYKSICCSYQGFPKNESLLNNTMRILKACPEALINEVQIGVNQAVSRLGFKVVPINIFSKVLILNGFRIDQRILSWKKDNNIKLGNREKYFIDLVNKKGPIVTFDEICEEFTEKGLSRASAVSSTQWSPIVFRVSQGLYKICGYIVKPSDYLEAETRRIKIHRDLEFFYSINGEIIIEVNIDSWGEGGTITIQSLPNIEGDWYYYLNKDDKIKVKATEDFLYGLQPIFEELEVEKKDRIRIILNTWNRRIKIEKVSDYNITN